MVEITLRRVIKDEITHKSTYLHRIFSKIKRGLVILRMNLP